MIKIYKTIISQFFCMGVKQIEGALGTEAHLDLRGRTWQEAGKDCILRSFIIRMLHQILLE
jgi:hypothetical protein